MTQADAVAAKATRFDIVRIDQKGAEDRQQ